MASTPPSRFLAGLPVLAGRLVSNRYLLSAVAATAGLSALLVPRDRAPDPRHLDRIEKRLEMARSEGAGERVPDLLARATDETDRARLAVARESHRLPLLRSYGSARHWISEATRSSETVLTRTRADNEDFRVETGERLEEATRRLTEARAAAGTAHVGARGRQDLMQAEITLDEARRNYARGAYGRSRKRAEEVIHIGSTWQSRSTERLARFDEPAELARWQEWIDATIDWSAREKEFAIVVDKVGRTLILYQNGAQLVTFPVDLGLDPVSRKIREGDNATPEGRYKVKEIRTGRQTRYHLALLLDYPNAEDRARFREAQEAGVIEAEAAIGGLIEIHGFGGRDADWTNGCVAIANPEMDALVELVHVGTPVTIVGRRATSSAREAGSPSGPIRTPPAERRPGI